ncbi:14922_t:CDS:2, partial [Gigaspora margarita]
KKYKDTDLELTTCETMENQKIRNATGPKVIQKINILVEYYSELEEVLESLNEYVVCQKHYNQVIRNDNFIEKLQKNLKFSTSINNDYNNFKKQLEKITNQLNESKQQKLFYMNLAKELETKNNELEAKNNELEAKNNELEAKNNELNIKNSELETEYNESIAENYNNFKKQLDIIINQLNESEQQRILYTDLIKDLETKNKNLETENNELKEIINFNLNNQQIHFALESCKFRVYIKKNNFLSPSNNIFQSINGEWKLSEEMKKFSELAQMKRIEFIQKILIEKNSTRTWHPIPITIEEANFQKSKNSLQKQEILSIINLLLPYLNDIDRLKFKNLSNLSRNNLLIILQDIKNILAENNINFNEEI